MFVTIKTNLVIDEITERILDGYEKFYHQELEKLIQCYQKAGKVYFIGYRDISNKISFHSKEHLLRLAQKFYEIRKTHPKAEYHRLFVLSKRSFHIIQKEISMEFGHGFQKSNTICKTTLNKHQLNKINHGEILRMDVKREQKYYVARIIIKVSEVETEHNFKKKVMGVDLGMKCPAVCYTGEHKVRFIGNGREIKYRSRKITQHYQKIQKVGNEKKLRKNAHRLHNYKNHIDHCISKEIGEFAKQEQVDVIRLEKLLNLQQKFYRHDQVCWSYQGVSHYIEYKAHFVGIQVEYVDPYLTTKKYPACGKINNVKGRDYQCCCGFHKHRDLVGAMNILNAPKA